MYQQVWVVYDRVYWAHQGRLMLVIIDTPSGVFGDIVPPTEINEEIGAVAAKLIDREPLLRLCLVELFGGYRLIVREERCLDRDTCNALEPLSEKTSWIHRPLIPPFSDAPCMTQTSQQIKEKEDKVLKQLEQWDDYERATAYWVLYHQYGLRIDGARSIREKKGR